MSHFEDALLSDEETRRALLEQVRRLPSSPSPSACQLAVADEPAAVGLTMRNSNTREVNPTLVHLPISNSPHSALVGRGRRSPAYRGAHLTTTLDRRERIVLTAEREFVCVAALWAGGTGGGGGGGGVGLGAGHRGGGGDDAGRPAYYPGADTPADVVWVPCRHPSVACMHADHRWHGIYWCSISQSISQSTIVLR